MALRTDTFDSDTVESALARVLSPPSHSSSIYVKIPRLGRDRRTDGGAANVGSGRTIEYEGGIDSFDRGDYAILWFEPCYNDNHELSKVEHTSFTDPLHADEPKFPNTDVPKICPQCGREAAALVTTEYDSDTGGKASDTADLCRVDPDGRGAWFDFSSERSFVHGT